MRIVKNLEKTIKCPNCDKQMLCRIYDEANKRNYKKCAYCAEEIYEDEDTQYAITDDVFVVGKRPDDVDDSLMDIEYEVGNLPRYATNKDELEQLERIRNIFDQLISVIRRIK